jgi:hypothetical protein
MSKWQMRGQFRHLHFKTFLMTPRTPQFEVFWPFNSSSKFLWVSEDSKFPLLGVWALPSHLAQSGVTTQLARRNLQRRSYTDLVHNRCPSSVLFPEQKHIHLGKCTHMLSSWSFQNIFFLFNKLLNLFSWSLTMCDLGLAFNQSLNSRFVVHVTTLALGLRPKETLARLRPKKKAQESHHMLSRNAQGVKKWTFTLPSELPLWELKFEPNGLLNFQSTITRVKNPSIWKVLYIIGKLLKPICLKWACMIHLDIWNRSYGQKKGRDSNW